METQFSLDDTPSTQRYTLHLGFINIKTLFFLQQATEPLVENLGPFTLSEGHAVFGQFFEGAIPSKETSARRHLNVLQGCGLCSYNKDTTDLYILRECPFTQATWHEFERGEEII